MSHSLPEEGATAGPHSETTGIINARTEHVLVRLASRMLEVGKAGITVALVA